MRLPDLEVCCDWSTFFPLKLADLGTRDEPQRTSERLAQWARTRPPSQFLTQSYLSRHMFNMDEHAKCENSLSEWQAGILKIFFTPCIHVPVGEERDTGSKVLV